MSDDIWRPIEHELDLWRVEGRKLRLWLRDDDAVEPSEQLERLIAFSRRFCAPVLLAVIPMQAKPSLAARLADEPLIRPCQHGATHHNHAPRGEPAAEIGLHRPVDIVLAELQVGRHRLSDLFGANVLDIFVPPWNRIDPVLAAELPDLGFTGLSVFRGSTLAPIQNLSIVNPDLDVIEWKGGRVGRPHAWLVSRWLDLMREKRAKGESDAPLGILLHHLVHDETAWDFLETFFTRVAGHSAVEIADPAELFASAGLSRPSPL